MTQRAEGGWFCKTWADIFSLLIEFSSGGLSSFSDDVAMCDHFLAFLTAVPSEVLSIFLIFRSNLLYFLTYLMINMNIKYLKFAEWILSVHLWCYNRFLPRHIERCSMVGIGPSNRAPRLGGGSRRPTWSSLACDSTRSTSPKESMIRGVTYLSVMLLF